jgi:cytochrome c oxidase subunit II
MRSLSRLGQKLRVISPILPAAAFAAGCTAFADPNLPQSTVFPLSDWAHQIQNLYSLIFILAAIVFIAVEGFLLFTVLRYRRTADNRLPSQTHGNTTLEILWTILPAIVLLIIMVPSIGTIFASDAAPAGNNLRVKAIGHQWWWEFQYPDLGITTANEFHLPLNQTATFELESVDVIHSFWVPRMGGKVDNVPTRTNHMWYTPQQVGEFPGQCVEFCGLQHANMRLRLVVDTPEDFQRWVQRLQQPPPPIAEPHTRGAALFLGGACVSCHTINGTAAQGKVGPNLTNIGSRKTIAAGILENTPDNLKNWIQHPQTYKVGNKMPDLGLSDDEARAIAGWLSTLK